MSSGTIEANVWTRVIHPEQGDLPSSAAQALAELRFDKVDLEVMRTLAQRNQAGELSPDEQQSLQTYRRIGMILDLLRSKARLSLRQAGQGS
jgi:hypothetical protein